MRRLVPVVLLALGAAAPQPARYDGLIRGGHVIDGTGNPWFAADVGVRDGRIVAVARRLDGPAVETIDATGLVVTPGFIDLHAHSKLTLLRDGDAQSKVRQGVTLEVVGEGSSPAPRTPLVEPELERAGVRDTWATFREYFDLVQRRGIAVNLMSYVAAGQLRRMVMGEVFRKPTRAELERMKALAREAMRDEAAPVPAGDRVRPGQRARRDPAGRAHRRPAGSRDLRSGADRDGPLRRRLVAPPDLMTR